MCDPFTEFVFGKLGPQTIKKYYSVIREDNGTEVRIEKAVAWIVRMKICTTVLFY